MKIVRILILCILIGGAVRIARITTQAVFDLLSFQITMYKYLLSAQAQVADIGSEAKEFLGTASERLGLNDPAAGNSEEVQLRANENKLAGLHTKLRRFALIVGSIVGLLVFKISFDIVFGVKNWLNKFRTFIGE